MNIPENYHGFVYKTIFPDGKIYIGQTVRDINLKYFGSGKIVLKAIEKYGHENLKREILKFCNNQKELDVFEKIFIIKFNSTNSSIGYNLERGSFGQGRISESSKKKMSISKQGTKFSEETKNKMSISASKRNEDWKINHSEFMKNFRHSDESKAKIANKHRGMKRSEETRKRMSERMKESYKLRKQNIVS